MNRQELELIIRAAGEIAQVKKIIREILVRSIEADIMVPDSYEKTELIEGVMGELSLFHDTFGYYVQGVDRTTSKLPDGWESRLIEICNENTNYISGMCLDVHDLMISKLYAGRKKDIEFFMAAVNLDLLSEETLKERLDLTTISYEHRRRIENFIDKGFLK